MQIRYGEICLVDFEPSVGHEYQKQRPAIVIQSDRQLKASNLVTVMPLTSQVLKKHQDDILVRKDSKNLLFVDSLIKVHCITSFDKSRFIKKIGNLGPTTLEQIKQYLYHHFSLP